MKISSQMARSAAAATSGRTLHGWLRAAAYSHVSAISSSVARKGRSSCVAMDRARAAAAAVALAIQKTGARFRFQASAVAAITNAPRMAAVACAGSTLKLRVSSQSMGARISAEVPA